MRTLLLAVLMLICGTAFSQDTTDLQLDKRPDSLYKDVPSYSLKSAACGTPWLTTGNPAWTNYWSGFMINIINTNVCPITVTAFEAEFQGNSGYRIYTKAGTFVGFETNAAAWTTVGTIGGGLNGLGAGVMTPIPIAVNVTIPAGATQGFYLTRTSNDAARRHLYITGTGTPGTTVYASNADISITEGSYINEYFALLNAGTRRPSIDVCYTIDCALPIELVNFNCTDDGETNVITWSTASETNNDYFTVERSENGIHWEVLGTVNGAGNSNMRLDYEFVDDDPFISYTYYRLKQTDFDGNYEYSDVCATQNQSSIFYTYMKSEDNFSIHFSSPSPYQLYNSMGQMVKSGEGDSINTSGLPSGMYILKISDYTQKFILR